MCPTAVFILALYIKHNYFCTKNAVHVFCMVLMCIVLTCKLHCNHDYNELN